MIGTTLKVGMDTTAVSRGLSRISSGFGRFARTIGRGAAERVGHRMTDLAGRVALAIPGTIKDTADYVSTLSDLATKTGMSVKSLVELQEMMRVAGVQTSDTTKAIGQMADRLYEARTIGGEAKRALNDMGFSAQEFKNKKLDESFYMIGKRIAEIAGNDQQRAFGLMGDMFGIRQGGELLKLFNDFETAQAQMLNNTKTLTGQLGDAYVVDQLDKLADAMGRFETLRMSMGIAMIESLEKSFGPRWMDNLFDFLQNKVLPVVIKIIEYVGNFIERIRKGELGIGNMFAGIAESIGKGIAKGFQDAMSELNPIKKLDPRSWFGGGTTAMSSQESLKTTNHLLKRILDKTPSTPAFS